MHMPQLQGYGSGYFVNRFRTYRFCFHQQKTRKLTLALAD